MKIVPHIRNDELPRESGVAVWAGGNANKDDLQQEPCGKVQSLFHVTVHKGFPFKFISFYWNQTALEWLNGKQHFQGVSCKMQII